MTKKEHLQNAPKIFCENVQVGYTPEYLVVALSSGGRAETYAFTPAHAKRFSQYLAHEVEAFEKQHGAIDAQWNPNVVSPIQPAPHSEGKSTTD